MATTNIQTFPGDVTVTSNLTVNTNTLHVDSVEGRVGLGTTPPDKNFRCGGYRKNIVKFERRYRRVSCRYEHTENRYRYYYAN